MVRAAASGRLDIVMVLVKRGWRVDAPDSSASTALAAAAERGQLEVMRYLLGLSAHLNAKDAAGRTPLMRAAAAGQTAAVKLLLQAGATVDAVDASGRSAADYAGTAETSALLLGGKIQLVTAVKNGDLATVRRIATRDNVNVREDGRDEPDEQSGRYGSTPLILAAEAGNLDIVKVLVERGARIGDVHVYYPESGAQWEGTALDVAVMHGHADVVGYLLDKGATATDDLLLNACMNGHLDVVKLLADHGASVKVTRPESEWQGPDAGDWTPWAGDAISAAIGSGAMEIVDYLIQKGAKPSAFDVAAALNSGRISVASDYLARGAGVSQRVLVAAARAGDADITAEVIRRGGSAGALDVNGIGPDGFTPLTAAAEAGSLATVRMLLLQGADPGQKDGWAFTAADRIEDKQGSPFYEIRDLLERAGPDLRSYQAKAQLSVAVAKRDAATVRKLLAQKGDPNAEFTSLELPPYLSARLVDLACVMGSKDIVQLFIQYGATIDFTSPGLEYAARAGRADLVQLMLQAKEVEKGNLQGRLDTVLGIAAETGNAALLDLMLQKGARPDGGMEPALITAAARGHVEIAEKLLAKGATVDMKTSWSATTPLTAAMMNDQKEMVDLLLSHGATGLGGMAHGGPLVSAIVSRNLAWVRSLLDNGADVNATQPGVYPTLYSAVAGPLEIVQLLVSRGARLEDKDYSGATALARAATLKGNEAVTTFLLRQGAAVDSRTTAGVTPIDTFMRFGTWNEEIAGLLDKAYTGNDLKERFFIALMKRDLKAADSLLAEGAAVNAHAVDARAASDWTALMCLAAKGDGEAVSFLIAHGADPSLEERNNKQNAAEIAAAAGNSDIAKALLALLPDSQAMKERVLRQAARGGSVELVQLLLAQGAKPDATDAGGLGPVYYAASAGRTDVVALLLDKGVDVNRRNMYGFSALYAASSVGAKDVVEMLLAHGAKLGDGWNTGLSAALDAHRPDIARLVLDHATPEERKAAGIVALYRMADAGDLAAVKLLLDYGVPPTFVDTAGDTALTRSLAGPGGRPGYPTIARMLIEARAPLDARSLLLACQQGFADVVKAMLARGVDLDVVDEDGSYPIVLAARSGSVQTFSLLLGKEKTGLNPPELAWFIWPAK